MNHFLKLFDDLGSQLFQANIYELFSLVKMYLSV
jgi:hypothetical protein